VSEADPLVVEYDFSRRDYRHFAFYTQARTPLLWVLCAVAPAVVTLTNLGEILAEPSAFRRLLMFLGFFGTGASIAVVIMAFSTAIAIWFQPGVRTLMGRKKISLTPQALFSETEFSRTENYWRGIRKIVRSKRYLLIYNTALSAYIIPRRAFASAEDWDRFYEFARHQFEMSRNPASAIPPQIA
jgi:hypothetical protein